MRWRDAQGNMLVLRMNEKNEVSVPSSDLSMQEGEKEVCFVITHRSSGEETKVSEPFFIHDIFLPPYSLRVVYMRKPTHARKRPWRTTITRVFRRFHARCRVAKSIYPRPQKFKNRPCNLDKIADDTQRVRTSASEAEPTANH